jgi:phosphate transport system protein
VPREAYQLDLQDLREQVLRLAGMVDAAIGRAMDSLRDADHGLARVVVADDEDVNRQRYAIEEQSIVLIATQQPVASDLRTIFAIQAIAVDLERMGDYAVGIARVVLLHDGRAPLPMPLPDLSLMAEQGRGMLRRALDAFLAEDCEQARRIADEDDDVDTVYTRVYRNLIHLMIANPRDVDRATWLMWVNHNLERIADRVTNVCERIVYMATGELVEMNVSSY